MNQMKRKLTFNQSLKKKLRNDLNQSITCIENLSNEYLHEIFAYLEGYEIYKAFSNLNYRFQQFLDCPSLLFKTSRYNEQFLLLYKHKILSFKLWSVFNKNNFFSFFTSNPSLNHLGSLYIEILEFDILKSLLLNLSYLPRLLSLTIRLYTIHSPSNLNDIYRLIFALPTLKLFKFLFEMNHSPISLPIATNKQLSTIEYLSIYHSCTLNELLTILSYTPQMRRLNLFLSINVDPKVQNIFPITLSNLTNITIPMNGMKFDEFEILISNINSKLKVLRVNCAFKDITLFNARRWENLILKFLPQLEKFYFRYFEFIYDEYEYAIYPEEPDQFNSSFWIERKWIFQVQLQNVNIRYLIRPYRKTWYEYKQDKVEYSESTRLTIEDFDRYNLKEFLKRNIKRVLTIIQIYHLEITKENIHISLLIEAVKLLPQLKTLKIHSLSLELINSEVTNKITDVYLQTMNEIKELDFLFKLCPYMEYLKIDSIKHMDLKLILRYILTKIKCDYLRLLCFRIPTADDEMIQKLKTMINSEKLLFNYTIKRVVDNIYLEWNDQE